MCGVEKELSDYYFMKDRQRHRAECRDCQKSRDRKRKQETYDPIKKREYDLKTKYDITLDQYDDMYEEQQGRCAICGTDQPGGRGNHFAVDHDHLTGQVRSLLCEGCNTGLGKFKDNPDLLRSAQLYLLSYDRTINPPE
jgi:hypothetical protein